MIELWRIRPAHLRTCMRMSSSPGLCLVNSDGDAAYDELSQPPKFKHRDDMSESAQRAMFMWMALDQSIFPALSFLYVVGLLVKAHIAGCTAGPGKRKLLDKVACTAMTVIGFFETDAVSLARPRSHSLLRRAETDSTHSNACMANFMWLEILFGIAGFIIICLAGEYAHGILLTL